MKQPLRTSEEMYPLIESFLESGETVREFSQSHDQPFSVFTYWLSKYRREKAAASAFVEISPVAQGAMPVVELVCPNGIRLRFFSPVSPSYLASVLSVVAPER